MKVLLLISTKQNKKNLISLIFKCLAGNLTFAFLKRKWDMKPYFFFTINIVPRMPSTEFKLFEREKILF